MISLGELLVSLDQGWSPKCLEVPSSDPRKWAVIKTTAIQPLKFNASENKQLPDNLISRPHLQILSGDILITRAGPRSRVGIACYVKDCRTRLLLCDKAYRLRVREELADAKYIAFMLNSDIVVQQIEALKSGISDSGLNLKQNEFLDLKIPAPSLTEQRRIVARIEALFARTRRARADLERIAPLASKYVEAETDRAYDHATKPGWLLSVAGNLCEIKSGVTLGKRYAQDAQLVERPYLRVANVQRGHLKLDEIKSVRLSVAEADRLALQPGDVLMNEGGDRDKLGRGWVWNDEIPGCVHQNHVFRLRLHDEKITPRFLSRYANHAGAQYFLGEGKQTTNLASISMSKVAALPVPVPPMGEAAEIDRKLDAVCRSAATCEQQAGHALSLLDRLERSILARAFRGELVPQKPSEQAEAPSAAASQVRIARRAYVAGVD